MQSRRRLLGPMDTRGTPRDATPDPEQTYNPWTIVNLVFRHLADSGLRPVLGTAGDPGKPAAELLRALGITPAAEGDRRVAVRAAGELARLRAAFEAGRGEEGSPGLSQVESTSPPDPMSDPAHKDFPVSREGCR